MKTAYTISAAIFSLIALVIGALVFQVLIQFQPPVSNDPVISVWAVGAGAFLSALLLWWLLILRPTRMTWLRGALAGALTGLLAHPLAFILSAFASLARFGPPSEGWLTGILLAPVLGIVLSLFSLMVIGWLTVPLGAAAGGLIARYFQNR